MENYMGRHAYLISAHNQPELLKILLSQLDVDTNDIVLHIDKKSSLQYDDFLGCIHNAKLLTCDRISVAWGAYSQIDAILTELKTAFYTGEHIHYHLLSGADLPLRNIREINAFYDSHSNKNFVNFDDPARFQKQYALRLKYKHYFREKCGRDKNIYTIFNKVLCVAQRLMKISNKDTISSEKFVFGSEWSDLTEDFVNYILSHESEIKKHYQNTSCADEVFAQDYAWNTEFRSTVWKPTLNNGMEGNMRYIDFSHSTNAGAMMITDDIVDKVLASGMMFARKFDYDRYPGAINKVIEHNR